MVRSLIKIMCQEFHLNKLVVLQVEHPGTFYTFETKMEVVLNLMSHQTGKISDLVYRYFVISSKHAGKSFCFHPSLSDE